MLGSQMAVPLSWKVETSKIASHDRVEPWVLQLLSFLENLGVAHSAATCVYLLVIWLPPWGLFLEHDM
jgi:hypothetical protein